MRKLISFTVPCYQSAETLPLVVSEICELFTKQSQYDYEIILANDASTDNTMEVIRELCKVNNHVVGIDLTRNMGQEIARLAAISSAKGDYLVSIDDDGQHPVKEVFKLIDKLNEGYDVVFAHLQNKCHSRFKRITSSLTMKIMELLGNKPHGVNSLDFFCMNRLMGDAVRQYKSPFPYLCGYMMSITNRFASVDVPHRRRITGATTYSLRRLISLFVTMFTNFSLVPLRLATIFGFVSAFGGFAFGIFCIIEKILQPSIEAGYTSLVSLLLFIGGVLMIMVGLLGEYLGRTYMVISMKPQYVIRETVDSRITHNTNQRCP